ncbi:MAG: SDR family oxidoreductase [Proteobacteria bacterium]|nr:SDR family oxidoreductase [Pseudomonadota bacterium]MBU4470564.1 SDR family oxidoreductase [Pseudomonadota bacterium]MCG2751400.1 SDR family oxidoreductase [Desulfobacteraceae bacterium]
MSDLRYNLKDKVALVTGGSRGIGLELARYLLKEGARVVICGRKKENLDAAVKELQGGGSVLAVPAHIGKPEDVDTLFKSVMDTFSKLDILINNVGMNLPTSTLDETDPAMWQKIIDSNLTGTFLVSRKASQIMKRQGGGKIVTISSIAARKSSPGMGIYGIAKAAVEQMTRVLASELASSNIQVNAVAPGMVRTGFSKPFWANENMYNQIVKGIPMGRIAEPIDVVHPTLFLSSEGADFITGQIFVVDSGQTIT